MNTFFTFSIRLAIGNLVWPVLLYIFGVRGWPLAFGYCVGIIGFWVQFALERWDRTLLPPPPTVYFIYKKKRWLMHREDLHGSAQGIRETLTSAGPLYISEDSSVVLAVVLDGPERGVVKVFEVEENGQYAESGKAFDHIPKMVRKLRRTAPAGKAQSILNAERASTARNGRVGGHD